MHDKSDIDTEIHKIEEALGASWKRTLSSSKKRRGSNDCGMSWGVMLKAKHSAKADLVRKRCAVDKRIEAIQKDLDIMVDEDPALDRKIEAYEREQTMGETKEETQSSLGASSVSRLEEIPGLTTAEILDVRRN